MAKKRQDEGGGYSWMDTYGDLVTLLMCFFVLLFSMSSINEEKWEALVRSFTARGNDSQQLIISPPDGEGNDIAVNSGQTDSDDEKVNIETLPENFDDLYKYIKTYINEKNMQGSVSVEKSGDNSVYIRFQDNIFFEPDSATLLPGSTDVLTFIGECIKAVEDQVLMTRINGHTAAMPNDPNYRVSDRLLSSDRANAVLMYFEDVTKIDGKKLMSQGYGKYFPVADNATAEGRQKNRRVELMILSNDVLAGSADELNKMMQDTLSSDLFNDHMNTEGMLMPPDPVTDNAEPIGSEAPAPPQTAPSQTPQQSAPSQAPESTLPPASSGAPPQAPPSASDNASTPGDDEKQVPGTTIPIR